MSWQLYVDYHLMCEIVEGLHLTAAAIIGQDDGVWAQSAAFPQFKHEEISNIMKDFDEPGFLAPTGLFFGGTKYMIIQGEPGTCHSSKEGFRRHEYKENRAGFDLRNVQGAIGARAMYSSGGEDGRLPH